MRCAQYLFLILNWSISKKHQTGIQIEWLKGDVRYVCARHGDALWGTSEWWNSRVVSGANTILPLAIYHSLFPYIWTMTPASKNWQHKPNGKTSDDELVAGCHLGYKQELKEPGPAFSISQFHFLSFHSFRDCLHYIRRPWNNGASSIAIGWPLISFDFDHRFLCMAELASAISNHWWS